MGIKVILFDLDGTLLPLEQNSFIKAYFGSLSKKLAAHGYDPKLLVDAIWGGTAAMVANDGKKSNEEVFWDFTVKIFGNKIREDEYIFNEYYDTDFDLVQGACGYNPAAKETVLKIKDMGYRVALATNPLFPAVATRKRVSWTGLNVSDFELYTTYENSRYCKPNLEYYKDVISALGVSAEECLMVGNDVDEDMITEELGMKVFLITECLLNKSGKDISRYPNGDFKDLLEYIKGK